ncbi:MAG: hypothetical protein Q9167_002778 [Letrouitia subvulpina]
MLQRQQSQLIAGVQELYSRLRDGSGWPGDPLELNCHGQASVHAVLERLRLLDGNDAWNEAEDSESEQQLPESHQSPPDEIQKFPETAPFSPSAVLFPKECPGSSVTPSTNDFFPSIDAFQDTTMILQPDGSFSSPTPTPLTPGEYLVQPPDYIPISPVPPIVPRWTNGGDNFADCPWR